MSNFSVEQIEEQLFALQDKKYGEFQVKLIPTVPPDSIIGCRTPDLRSYAKELYKAGIIEDSFTDTSGGVFLNDLTHKYFDENQLHAFILNCDKDFSRCINLTDKFLPYVDNWATCDQLSPKIFGKQGEKLLPHIEKWLSSEHAYTVRFGIRMLMQHFLDKKFESRYLEKVAAVNPRDEYYIKMMQAWYFATALAKQYDAAVSYIQEKRLEKWTHNKTIQKVCESYRVTEEHKTYLKSLKW